MQRSWRADYDKLTFIILSPCQGHTDVITSQQDNRTNMIGDVNLFLSPDDDDEQDKTDSDKIRLVGELEIMIARHDQRGKGYAKAALVTFVHYIDANLTTILQEYVDGTAGHRVKRAELAYFRVKISADNERSIGLFRSLSFREMSAEPNYFNEIELRLSMPLQRKPQWACETPMQVIPYRTPSE